MENWQRITALAAGVAVLHGAALWAAHGYRVRVDARDQQPTLLTRMLELPKPLEAPPPPPLPPPPPTPVLSPPPKKTILQPSPAPQPSAAPVPAPAVPAPMPFAQNNPAPAPNAPMGSATPEPLAAPPASAVASTVTAAKAPVTAPITLPLADVEQADNQYRAPYPKMSQRLGEEGRVLLRVMVGPDGKPTSATVSKSSGSEHLDRAGIDTVMRWRFKPGTRGGVPEAMSVLQPVDFKLPN